MRVISTNNTAAFLLIALSILALTNCGPAKTKRYDGKKWVGTWRRNTWQNEAGLDITAWAHDSLTFSLQAGSGGHTGEVEGVAVFTDSIATCNSVDENDTCIIHFTRFGDSLIVINTERGNCFTASGVTYDGKYYNANYRKANKAQDNKPKTFVDLGILDSAQDVLLRSITGADYRLFFNSTQLTSTDDDMDSLHAKVYSSGIRGLFTEMENIVMVDSTGHIWAAVLDDDSKVRYYTNDPGRAELPKTIEHWRERFKQDTVLYRSKP